MRREWKSAAASSQVEGRSEVTGDRKSGNCGRGKRPERGTRGTEESVMMDDGWRGEEKGTRTNGGGGRRNRNEREGKAGNETRAGKMRGRK